MSLVNKRWPIPSLSAIGFKSVAALRQCAQRSVDNAVPNCHGLYGLDAMLLVSVLGGQPVHHRLDRQAFVRLVF